MVTAAAAAEEQGEAWLRQAQQLIPVLLAESSLVKAFFVRWKMINSRLEQLPSLLCEFDSSPCFSKNTLCTDMLESMVSSLEEARELVSQCTLLDYGGKLQMQSRLDSLATKLDGYLHDCRLMIESGVLRQSAAPLMTVSVMGVSKESRKWTVKDLLARLQIGSTESKIKALEGLVDFMAEDDKNVLVVAASQGGVPALVHLLDASVPVMREKATAAVSSLATVESCVHQIVSEGALQPLVRLLDPARGSAASEKAAKALQSLTSMPENARAVASHGGVAPLLGLCRGGTPGGQAAAAGVLRNLSGVAELRQEIAEEEDALAVLIYLVSSGTSQSREHAAATLQNLAATLQNLAATNETVKKTIIWGEGIEPLVRFLDGAEAPAAQEIGIGLLHNLAVTSASEASEAHVVQLIEAGFLHQLAGLLANGSPSVQQCAASAVSDLGVSAETRRSVGEVGCIPPLVKMLDAKTSSAQECAARALANLLEVESNRKLVAAEEKGISGLVRLLDVGTPNVGARLAVVGLSLLAAGNAKLKKQMVAAGAGYHLGRLAEMEVPGAKKLLERLEGGKIRSLLKKLDMA